MGWLSEQRYAAELAAETERLATVAAGLPPERVVPTCPEWTVRDLVTHVGSGHRYALRIVESRAGEAQPWQIVAAPDDPGEWRGWLADGAERLAGAVHERGFDGAVWTWQPRFRTNGFWLRRMLHDLIIHRFDAELTASAEELGDLATDLAVDGIDDLLLAFLVFDKLAGDGASLQFTAVDAGLGWHAVRTPGGLAWHEAEAPADVAVAAPARELLLILNRRLPLDAVTGDEKVWESWLEDSRF